MGLRVEDARGQCYDGAASMSGKRSGVATQFKSLNPKMLYTHCHGHALNLAVKDACSQVSALKETFEMAREITKLVKDSPQRNMKLEEIRKTTVNECKSIHAFCPTRWTVRGEALSAISNNHDELMELWDWSLNVLTDTEMKARIRGAIAAMQRFQFFFGCQLGEAILRLTDNLSRVLQNPLLSAIESQELVHNVVALLLVQRSDDSFDQFWKDLLKKQQKFNSIEEATLPRIRKIPARYDEGHSKSFHHETPKSLYRQFYFQAYDNTIENIKRRFDQPDFQIYVTLQSLLLKSAAEENFDEEFEVIEEFYEGDFDFFTLKSQLKLFPKILKRQSEARSISSIISELRDFSREKRAILCQVVRLIKLILVAPATNAISERSFSALKRIKTYLRSTMKCARLNHMMVLHVHKEMLDNIDLKVIANEFSESKQNRMNIFGQFEL